MPRPFGDLLKGLQPHQNPLSICGGPFRLGILQRTLQQLRQVLQQPIRAGLRDGSKVPIVVPRRRTILRQLAAIHRVHFVNHVIGNIAHAPASWKPNPAVYAVQQCVSKVTEFIVDQTQSLAHQHAIVGTGVGVCIRQEVARVGHRGGNHFHVLQETRRRRDSQSPTLLLQQGRVLPGMFSQAVCLPLIAGPQGIANLLVLAAVPDRPRVHPAERFRQPTQGLARLKRTAASQDMVQVLMAAQVFH
jgi:hypothetical protein